MPTLVYYNDTLKLMSRQNFNANGNCETIVNLTPFPAKIMQ